MFTLKLDSTERSLCQVCFEYSLQSLYIYQEYFIWYAWEGNTLIYVQTIQVNVDTSNNVIWREEKQLVLIYAPIMCQKCVSLNNKTSNYTGYGLSSS
jgi:hypothetical protein